MTHDNRSRCAWVSITTNIKPFYVDYHDTEWGVPVHDDQLMFEFLTLEAFQAGLSWEIVLKKRANFRAVFDQFDPVKVTNYGEDKVQSLLQDAGIIRNQLKIRATINNARRFLEVADEYGSFCDYLWGFVNGKPIVNKWRSMGELPATTDLSDTVAKDLKQRGFKFLGSTVMYAHMQAVGMINDHEVSCFRYKEVQEL